MGIVCKLLEEVARSQKGEFEMKNQNSKFGPKLINQNYIVIFFQF
jgi:hypothetical protein